jgi:thiol-disulfide isomerase/thioredoxin
MFAQRPDDRRRVVGLTALSLAAAWIGTRDSVIRLVTVTPFRRADAHELASLGRATAWLNSAPLSAADLQGKVVLVDFWTYTCINWLRTVPHVRAWARRYKDHGLVVVGVHTPEFGFETRIDNVQRAAQARDISYPIAIDNDRAIWHAFGNHYWPALYFVDAHGRVRDHHFGEGRYAESELTIRQLLTAAGRRDGTESASGPRDARGPEVSANWRTLKSPETYLGSRQRRYVDGAPLRLGLNQWGLSGQWTRRSDAVVLNRAGGRIAYRFHARDLHLVMGPPTRDVPVRFRVSLDGQAPGPAHGADVDAQGDGTAVDQRLYQLIRQPAPITDRHFSIEFLDPGVEAFAFTFG